MHAVHRSPWVYVPAVNTMQLSSAFIALQVAQWSQQHFFSVFTMLPAYMNMATNSVKCFDRCSLKCSLRHAHDRCMDSHCPWSLRQCSALVFVTSTLPHRFLCFLLSYWNSLPKHLINVRACIYVKTFMRCFAFTVLHQWMHVCREWDVWDRHAHILKMILHWNEEIQQTHGFMQSKCFAIFPFSAQLIFPTDPV